ncbi:MAG: type II toxin-antitoxin system HicB family antitoxin [Dehalococcoidia bacterium]|nr:type II toxin-antitoxin system HicB family antitoxin [Dehalococcoidia bacterium]
MSHRYTIILHPEEGHYWVSVPALPGCYTQGDTIPETIARAQEAIQVYLESLRIDGEPIPEETEHPQAITIDVAA